MSTQISFGGENEKIISDTQHTHVGQGAPRQSNLLAAASFRTGLISQCPRPPDPSFNGDLYA
jgi:hypothetical protein